MVKVSTRVGNEHHLGKSNKSKQVAATRAILVRSGILVHSAILVHKALFIKFHAGDTEATTPEKNKKKTRIMYGHVDVIKYSVRTLYFMTTLVYEATSFFNIG